MNKIIQGQLDGIETALSNLVDSISSYNPSVQAASNLLQADVELQESLKQLQTHAQNTARITSLRQTIARQNALITSHLQLLADTRADLLSVPASLPAPTSEQRAAAPGQEDKETSSGNDRNVNYSDLLAYAKHIARFNPAAQAGPFKRTKDTPVQSQGDQTSSSKPTSAMVETKSVSFPGDEAAAGAGKKEGRGMQDLDAMEKQWLDPWTGVLITPWPGEDVLKRGGLAELQAIVERGGVVEGLEGGGVKIEELQGQETAAGAKGDEQQTAEEQVVPIDVQAQPQLQSRPAEERRVEEKPKVFGGLDLYNPDEEG